MEEDMVIASITTRGFDIGIGVENNAKTRGLALEFKWTSMAL